MTFKHKYNYLFKLVLGIFLLSMLANARAVDMDDLFISELEIEDDHVSSRNNAIKIGLAKVIKQLSLQKDILSKNSLLKKELLNASAYTQGYSYEKVDGKLKLLVKYSQNSIKKLLLKAGVPYLSEQRPAIVFWLQMDTVDQSNKFWLGEYNGQMINELEQQGSIIGLPVVVPLFDYADTDLLNGPLDLEHEARLVDRATQRYNTDMIVVAKVIEFAGAWKCVGHIHSNGKMILWKSREDNIEAVMANLMATVSKIMIDNYAIGSDNVLDEGAVPSESDSITMQISGVDSLLKYEKIIDYLHSLPGVINVQPEDLSADQGVFIVSHNKSKQALLRSIRLDKFLLLIRQENESLNNPGKYDYDFQVRL